VSDAESRKFDFWLDGHFRPGRSGRRELGRSPWGSEQPDYAAGLTPYEYICKIWTAQPGRFTINPAQHSVGLNT
jgi:hypothetical protein